jgi:hypothetical protein
VVEPRVLADWLEHWCWDNYGPFVIGEREDIGASDCFITLRHCPGWPEVREQMPLATVSIQSLGPNVSIVDARYTGAPSDTTAYATYLGIVEATVALFGPESDGILQYPAAVHPLVGGAPACEGGDEEMESLAPNHPPERMPRRIKERRQQVEALYREGLTASEMAERLGCGESTIRNDLACMGLRLRASAKRET